jgi:hypothetical protein
MADATGRVLRASLKAKLYRDIEIGSGRSLYDLAEGIIGAFGFDFDHAFGFYSKLTGRYTDAPIRYELFADMADADRAARSVKRSTVAQAFPKIGTKMLFLYDYGDEWRFTVELIALTTMLKSRRPQLVAALGQAPPQYSDMDEE